MSQPTSSHQKQFNEKSDQKDEQLINRADEGKPKQQGVGVQELQNANESFIQANMELAQSLKKQGNQLFKTQQYNQAILKYRQALRYTPKDQYKLRCILYSNLSICFSKLSNFKDSINYCKKSIQCDPTYMKAHLNLAINYQKNENLQESLAQYKKILEMNPKDLKHVIKIKDLQKRIQQQNEKMKTEAIEGLKSVGNSILGFFGMSLDNFKMQKGENGGYSVSLNK